MNERRRRQEAALEWLDLFGEPFAANMGVTIPGGQTYAEYIASLSPLLWLRLRETSGTTVANSGSLGAAGDGAWTAGTGAVGQTGQLGPNEAYLWDGANSKIDVPALAGYNSLTTYTWMILCNPTSAGESNIGHLISTDLGTTRVFRINSVNRELNFFNTATGGGNVTASSITANGFLALSAWQLLFVTFDNAGDRKARIYKYVSGALTEATYVTQDAMVGTIAVPATPLCVGARAAQTFTFNGPIDEAAIFGSVLSTAQMAQIGALAGL